jgi:hypothetical protein
MKAGFIGTNDDDDDDDNDDDVDEDDDDDVLDKHCQTTFHKDFADINSDDEIGSTKLIETEQEGYTSKSDSTCKSVVDYSVDDISDILNQLYVCPEWKVGDEEDQVDGDDLDHIFCPFDGSAMFSVACKMNHSCKPNVIVRYATAGWYCPLTLECVALREIQKDEELCISYIDFTFNSMVMDVQDRWNQLESYGFKCNCERCLLERQQ